jgi:hypothetical protein
VRAVELTFYDSLLTLLSTTLEAEQERRVTRIGGLRGGRLVSRSKPHLSLRLDRYTYVPGVAVSGELARLSKRGRLRLRVRGSRAAHGAVTFDLKRDRIRGRLGHRRVRLSLTRDIGEAVSGLFELRQAVRAEGLALRGASPAAALLGRR